MKNIWTAGFRDSGWTFNQRYDVHWLPIDVTVVRLNHCSYYYYFYHRNERIHQNSVEKYRWYL